MLKSRTQKSTINAMVLIFLQFFGIIINFVARYFFIKYLGEIYLGLNGVLTNIVGVLSFAELGIGSAIAFSLYKPLADNDIEKIKSIMALYKKVYLIVGAAIFIIGLALLPTIKYLVGDDYANISNLSFIYTLFILNTAVTYTYSYKRTLICADQNKYIDSINRYIFMFVLFSVQIIILSITRNFILYLLCQTFSNLLENISITIIVNKKYSYIKEKSKKLDNSTRKGIFKNVNALMFHKLGSIFVGSTDSILITIFVGLAVVGRYSNYLLISSGVSAIITQLYAAFTSSVGNLGAIESDEKKVEVFNKILIMNFGIINFCTISLFFLFNNFITIWIGDYLLSNFEVMLIVINFFIACFRNPVLLFKDALGIYAPDKFKPIFEIIVNLGVSILLGFFFGLAGILVGTIITYLTVSIWVETRVLFKYGLKESQKRYYKRVLCFLLVFLLSFILTFLTLFFVPQSFLWSLFIRILACIIIPNFVFLVFYHKTSEIKYFKTLLKNFFKREKT